jgi:transposase
VNIRRVSVLLVVAASSCCVGFAMAVGPRVPPKVHSWVLMGAAVFFSVSEGHYKGLLSELSAILRRGSYSLWQVEQLQQVVPRVRDRIWMIWDISLALKVLVGLAAAALQWDAFPGRYVRWTVGCGYGLTVVALWLTLHGRRRFRELEKRCDEVAAREIALKEERRLKADLASGAAHDFDKDPVAQSYSKPRDVPPE